MKLSDEDFATAINIAFNENFQHIRSLWENQETTSIPLKFIQKEKTLPFISSIYTPSKALFPLSMRYTPQFLTRNIVLIGDALRTLHPLAGQGLNLGIGDVIRLAQAIRRNIESGNSVGTYIYISLFFLNIDFFPFSLGYLTPLKDYARKRQLEVLPIVTMVDGLQKLFSMESFPFPNLRSFGLQALNHLPFLKVI
jgi:ubiquinone biosynthesis monooxygenase Coq6